MLEFGEDALRDAIKTIGLFNTKAKNVIALSPGADRRLWRRSAAHPRRARVAARRRPQDRQCRAQHRVRARRLSRSTPTSSASATAPASRPARTVDGRSRSSRKSCPQPFRRDAHHWLILHGRYTCKARTPECWRCPVIDLCRYKPKTPPPEAAKPSAARSGAPSVVSSSYCERPDCLDARRQIVVDLDPIAFLELGRGVAVDRDQVHRHPAEHRQREFAGERRAAPTRSRADSRRHSRC